MSFGANDESDDELHRAFDTAIATARQEGPPLPSYFRAGLPSALALGLQRRPSRALAAHYLEHMPRRLVAQWQGHSEAVASLVASAIPGTALVACLEAMATELGAVGLSFAEHLGAPDVASLLATRPSIAALYFESFFGGGLPLLGLSAADQRAIATAADPVAWFETYLLGNVMHELCHGQRRVLGQAPMFLFTEAAAIHLGGTIARRHVFAERPGEAVPAASAFYLLGLGLERLLGRRALWSLAGGASLSECWPAALAESVAAAERDDDARYPDALFAADASRAFAWLRLVDMARSGAHDVPRTLADATRVPIARSPWAHEPATALDWEIVTASVDALCSKSVHSERLDTVPAEVPLGRLVVDPAAATIACVASRPDGVLGEPGAAWLPPPIVMAIAARGVRRLELVDVTRAARHRVVARLRALCAESSALPSEVTLSC